MTDVRLVNGCGEVLTIEGPSRRAIQPGETFEADERTAAILLRTVRGIERLAEPPAPEPSPLIIPAGARTAPGRA